MAEETDMYQDLRYKLCPLPLCLLFPKGPNMYVQSRSKHDPIPLEA